MSTSSRGPVPRPAPALALALALATALTLVATLVSPPSLATAASPEFYAAWGDGRGEVAIYELTEERYHEPREGHAVLVTVTEELDVDTHVKVESSDTPPEERMYVVKQNLLRKFATGVYDYSTMTSTFVVPESYLGHAPFQAVRVVSTTQEWCGQVFQRLDLRRDGWHVTTHSYFESEGDRSSRIPERDVWTEDGLWLRARELDGRWLDPGESATLALIPALWEGRKAHRPPSPHRVVVTKRDRETLDTRFGRIDAYPWTWTLGERQVTLWVEADGAHRILRWTDSNAGEAELASCERLAYWELNDDHAIEVRLRLGLPSDKLPRRP